jgi:hypothetical protein
MAGKAGQNDMLALALARGETVAAAARAAGLSERTVRRRLEDAEFRRLVESARGELWGAASGLLSALASKAAGVLGELMDSDSESIRLSAARAALEHGTALRGLIDLESKVSELERVIDEHCLTQTQA